jgi:hypothetical protein
VEVDGRSLLGAVEAAAGSADRGWQGLDVLVRALVDVDAAGDDGLARAALRVLGRRPALVTRIDEHARRVLWSATGAAPLLDPLVARLHEATPGPVAVAVAGTHRDGRIRERAVAAMLDRPLPELMPFLALRTGDWVGPVRDRARAGLALLLADDAAAGDADGDGGYLAAVLPTTVLMRPRLRGGFVHGQALAALITAPEPVRRALAGTGDRRLRRFVFDVALAQGGMGVDDLVAVAESDDDVRIRVRAAEAACREAVWTRRVRVLRRLAGHRRAEVRVVALTGLARIGETTTVAACLDDGAPLVRALARAAAAGLGTDVPGHYRVAVTAPVPAVGAVMGLAEAGSVADAALLRPLLTHADRTVRAAAVRALRQLDAVDVEGTLPLLHDPSPAVVREATAALRPFPRRVPEEVAWQLLAHPRMELRRAGYRLLRDRSTAVHLRAALTLAVDPHPDLARRGLADVTRLARDAALPSRRRGTPTDLTATADGHDRLAALIQRAAPALGPGTTGQLMAWLAATRPQP